jgi:uncharacterized membrane protein HdeD (DUF308 family)
MLAALSENWWALALRGLLAMLFGFAALFLPLDTLEAVGRLFGVYAITEGVLVVLTAIRGPRYRGAFIAEGASGIVAGLLALAWPSITALVLLYVVAIWAILSGVAEMIAGTCRARGHRPVVHDAIAALGYVGLALLLIVENLFLSIRSEVVLWLPGFFVGRSDLTFAGTLLAATSGRRPERLSSTISSSRKRWSASIPGGRTGRRLSAHPAHPRSSTG